MPLDRFVLILVLVVVAAGFTVWLASAVFTALQVSAAGWFALVPALLVGYVVWRVIADRLGSKEDDHYDQIEK